MKDDNIFVLSMDDYESVLKQFHTQEEIDYINKKFTQEQIQQILCSKICIEWDEYIDAVIKTRLLEGFKEEV